MDKKNKNKNNSYSKTNFNKENRSKYDIIDPLDDQMSYYNNHDINFNSSNFISEFKKENGLTLIPFQLYNKETNIKFNKLNYFKKNYEKSNDKKNKMDITSLFKTGWSYRQEKKNKGLKYICIISSDNLLKSYTENLKNENLIEQITGTDEFKIKNNI